MIITGLENDYYLSGNDIWIKVSGTESPSLFLDVEVRNETTGVTLDALRPYPNLDNEYKFNICLPVRALFPEPDHLTVNSLQKITIRITATLDDGSTEISSTTKYFLRGSKNKRSVDEWYLLPSQSLIVGKWVKWQGITLPTEAYKLQGNGIVEFVAPNARTMYLRDTCNVSIVKFLNSLGGYQYWVFESTRYQPQSKPFKSKNLPAYRLRDNVSRQLGVSESRELVLQTKVPIDLQEIIQDLIISPDIYLFDPEGTDDLSKWQRLELSGTNEAPLNTSDRSYVNELKFALPSYRTIEI